MDEIFIRRSVRRFDERKVEKEKLIKMVQAGMQAPSAMNQQAWEFLIVENREKMQEITKYNQYANCLNYASAIIVILGNKSNMVKPAFWEQDLGAATQNVLLQATSLNLGAVWIGVQGSKVCQDAVSEIFELNTNMLPYSIVAVGYPAKENANYYIDRYDQDKVHFEKMGKK